MHVGGTAIRAVVDTDIFVRALLHDIGRLVDYDSSRVVAAIEAGEIVPILSNETYDELKDILRYKIAVEFDLLTDEINDYIDDINACAQWVTITNKLHVCVEDPNDDKFIETACVAQVPYLVAIDRHFHQSAVTKAHLKRDSVELLYPADILKRIP